jgi:hypothetical protein
MPQEDNQNYDGTWMFTGADCPNTGAVSARIIGGKIFVRQVDPDDTLHSVRAGNGSASVELPDRAPKRAEVDSLDHAQVRRSPLFACANRLLQVHIQFFLSGFACTRTLS